MQEKKKLRQVSADQKESEMAKNFQSAELIR